MWQAAQAEAQGDWVRWRPDWSVVRCCLWLLKPDSKREGSPLSQIQACLSQVSFKTPCLGSGWCPNSVTERKQNTKQLKSSKKIIPLRADKGNHFHQWLLLFMCGIKMAVLWKCCPRSHSEAPAWLFAGGISQPLDVTSLFSHLGCSSHFCCTL